MREYTSRRAIFSQLTECNSTKTGWTGLSVQVLLSKAWGAHSRTSQRFPEVVQKGLVVEAKEDGGNGLCYPALLTGWFHHEGAHRTSPHGDIAGFQSAFHSLGCLSKQPSLFPLWAPLLLEPSPSSGNMCLRPTFGSLGPHLEWLSVFAFFLLRLCWIWKLKCSAEHAYC